MGIFSKQEGPIFDRLGRWVFQTYLQHPHTETCRNGHVFMHLNTGEHKHKYPDNAAAAAGKQRHPSSLEQTY